MYNRNMGMNNSMFSGRPNSVAYVRVEAVDPGNIPFKQDTKFIIGVGPRTSVRLHPAEFNIKTTPSNVWNFPYNNANTSSFVISLLKKKNFGGNEGIGEVELRLSSFEPNKVTTQDFYLQTPNNKYYNVKVKISVHICENGSYPFMAQANGKLMSNPIIEQRYTYYN